MGFYFHRTPRYIERMFPNSTWRIGEKVRAVYLTFDDGPTPEVTPVVLDILKEYQAEATFFCLGSCLDKHPDIGRRIVEEGHLLANHGYDHLDGWRISKKTYLQNKLKGRETINLINDEASTLFRPPYGHFREFKDNIMWSLMSGDFDRRITKERCLDLIKSKTRPGEIVVFHDIKPALNKLQWILPKYLEFCRERGFGFQWLPVSHA